MSKRKTETSPAFFSYPYMGVCLFLVVATLLVYWQLGNHEFVVFDDRMYVTENPNVQAGLTLEGIKWAFTTTHAHNWHPLTWLSHMLDCQVFGVDPKGHHLTNVFLHILNSLLVFIVFRKMTAAFWKSAFVAALFALHPLHVESVAWVAERKDVLSTFFWILTMYAYVLYVERKDMKMYVLAVLFFALGLMAKPMLVTLPFVLLLLDYWPLGRLHPDMSAASLHAETPEPKLRTEASTSPVRMRKTTGLLFSWRVALRLFQEKIPFFALAAVSCAITVYAQQRVMKSDELFSFYTRISNSLISYVSYLGKMIWPTNLAIFYPHLGDALSIWHAGGAGLLLAGITVAGLWFVRRPYVTMGWFWYLGTLVPVIGLVQVGLQGMADRYSYIPLIGLFVVVAWGADDISSRWRYRRMGLAVLGGIAVLVLSITAWSQVRSWKNSFTLFQHAADVTDDNYWAHYNLGLILLHQGELDEALVHFQESLRIQPEKPDTLMNMGVVFAKHGDLDEAIRFFLNALEIRPDHAGVHLNLALAFSRTDKPDKALSHLSEAVRLDPKNPQANYLLGLELLKRGKQDEAIEQFEKTLSAKPDYVKALNDLAVAHAIKKDYEKAIAVFNRIIEIQPDRADAFYNIACLYSKQNRIEESVDYLGKALEQGYSNWDLIRTDRDLENIRSSLAYEELIGGR